MTKAICDSFNAVITKEYQRTNRLILRITDAYKTPTVQKRGLIDGVGSIAKSLFGTMDADDKKTIDEQLAILHDAQQSSQHAVKNQLKIIQATIAHIDETEKTVQHNEYLLANATKNLKLELLESERANNIQSNFIIISTILSELTRDAEDVLDYVTLLKRGIMHPRLTPIDHIIQLLKDANSQLPEGLYFPFRANQEEWSTIEQFALVSAYCDSVNIYTILRFPLISTSKYEILNVIALPVPEHNNTFSVIDIRYPTIAIDGDQHTYITLPRNDLQNCMKINKDYLCERNYPANRINPHSVCEVKTFLETDRYHENCNIKNIASNHSFWIALGDSHSWLYSVQEKQTVTFYCKDHGQIKEVIEKTGKITLKNNCKLMTEDTIIKSPKLSHSTEIETFLPQYNISILKNETKLSINAVQPIKLQNIVLHSSKLEDLNKQIIEMDKKLNKQPNTIFQSPHFIYPTATSGTVIVIILAIIITVVVIKKKKRNSHEKRVTLDIDAEYTIPRSILKRSNSTRF
ncbi:uncharacterized protein LOC118645157 [Monomorium pharaonis]|uniref:uncharacterized protein LOC118645157 n=1 Tax=Monomorium pharaonis TaxID=307658 RepID=UPI0017478C9C|nr:uncharacterized protein LOC118645157 [Monomorium pharaonis]